jgi:type IV secretory pathway VirB10-like protein
MKNVDYSGLNKNLLVAVGAIFGLSIGGIVLYTLFDNSNKQPQQKSVASNVSTPTDIAEIAKSAINVKKAKSAPVVLPPITPDDRLTKMGNPHNIQPGVADKDSKPEMFTSNESTATRDDTNVVTGTNTSVGVGTIDSQYKTQSSPYTIFAGSYIPAQMVNGINSDLNGMVIALVRSDVYDTTAGKYLLIPQGSKLVGTYNHDVAYGQNRLMVGWNRLIFPNGTSVVLHGQPGTDLQGFSGFSDDVDNHYARIFGSAFLMGAIFGGTSLAVGNQNTNPYQLSAGATMANQIGAQMSQAGIQVINKGLNIQPTIIIHEGYRFNVAMTADLVLKPYVYKKRDE